MKAKMLNQNSDNYVCEIKLNLQTSFKCTKLEHIFAKPFLASLDGHQDAWQSIQRNLKLDETKCICTRYEDFVQIICTPFCGTSFSTVGDAKTGKQWKMDGPGYGEKEETLQTIFASCGQQVDIWDEQRTSPIYSMTWRFNNIFLESCASDRNIVLYDMRHTSPIKKNVRSFDMRALDIPLMVHMDHASVVLDVDYFPTGKEFVKCIMCGSDEMNICLWKANASEKLDYNWRLKKKFQHRPHIKHVAHHRHLPKYELNCLKHSNPRTVLMVSEKKKQAVMK
ncbi:unnamed protein product [Nyctereutes procyonoides]|uniref:(raccoon dog) hypothetical protein n=1 Tax=Nyctereutes procyonoides TaxID=34880 RepID=A0A811Y208_NYCPR|nr:unnamed protein product [Nyctereutes procyonoides]